MDLSKHKLFPGWAPGMPAIGRGIKAFVLHEDGGIAVVADYGPDGDAVWRPAKPELTFDHNHPAAFGFMWEWAKDACKALGYSQYGLHLSSEHDDATGTWDHARLRVPFHQRYNITEGKGTTDGERLASLVEQLWDRQGAAIALSDVATENEGRNY